MSTDADTTPTDQKILVDVTPTGQTLVGPGLVEMPSIDVTPTGQTVVDATPTGQKIIREEPITNIRPPGPVHVAGGTVIEGRWRTDRCLASGGYGDVWQGVDLVTHRPIAVKILRTDAGNNDPSAIARMRQEAEILEAMDHPNIVSVYGFGQSRYGHYLVMEMLEGKAIDQLLDREGPCDPERAIPVVRQLLAALSAAHAREVLHRDIKPENIIVVREADGTETAKLVDFGIAKATRTLSEEGATLVQTRAGGFMGTPRYAAPEQAVGDPCGPNIDLFALGLVIAEWLTGRRRLDGERHGDVMQQLLSPDELDLSDVSYRWREWLSGMVRKNPRARFQTAQQALEQLETLVVKLHQPADFLEESSMPFLAVPEGVTAFGANDGPLELDFPRARPPQTTPPSASGPLVAPPRAAGNTAQLMRTVAVEPPARPARSPGYQLSRIAFVLAVAVISFAAVAVLLLLLGNLTS